MKKPLSLAIMVYNFDTMGGMERQAKRLAESLAARGVRVTVITTFFPPGQKLHERRGRLEIVRVPFLDWVPYEWSQRIFETVAGYVLLRRRSIDVIYAVQYTSARHAVRAARVLARPIVAKFACGGSFGDFSHLRTQKDGPSILLDLAAIDRYACISDELAAEVASNGLDPARCVMIRNGVDLARFDAVTEPAALPELGPADARKVVLFVGRLDHQKRVTVLVRAFARVLERFPEARLALAGKGPQAAELEALVLSLGVKDKVAFLGARPDVPALHRAASVFVLPSAAEVLPNVLLEALAAGTPSVATDIPGTNEVARHEREALLVPLDDVEALARAIERLLGDKALAARLAAAGRERILDEFDMEKVAARYLETFTSLRAPHAKFRYMGLALLAATFFWTIAFVTYGFVHELARRAITFSVVTAKRALGIQGDLLEEARSRAAAMKRLGVAILVYNIDVLAGMERQALLLAERLVARGARVTIVSSFLLPEGVRKLPREPRTHEWRNGLEILRVPFFHIGPPESSRQLYEIVAAHALLHRRSKIDVIYSVQFTCGRHAAALARVLERPTFLKLAGGGIQGDLTEIQRQPARAAILADLRELDHVVCLSAEIAEEARRSGLDPASLRHVPNGVDLGRFPRPEKPGERHEPPRLVFVGRLDPGKNIDSILRAFAALAPRFPTLELDLVGKGPSEEPLRALALELGLGARAHFLGARRDVPLLLRRSSVFLLPSVSEGMSNALLEALAAGVPVVATDIPGTNEIVAHERDALLVPVGDAKALEAAIERLLEDPALAARLAAAGRARVEAVFDMERVADLYASLFREAARRPRAARPDYRALARLHAVFYETAWRFLSMTGRNGARRASTSAVLALKRLLGIKRDLLQRS